jgi:hypothetical protein
MCVDAAPPTPSHCDCVQKNDVPYQIATATKERLQVMCDTHAREITSHLRAHILFPTFGECAMLQARHLVVITACRSVGVLIDEV